MSDMKQTSAVSEVLHIFENDWNRQVILYGPPGTSKTYSAVEIAAKFLARKYHQVPEPDTHEACKAYLEQEMAPKGYYKVIQFHPSYSYEDFVRGITVSVENGQALPSYQVKSKILESFCQGMEDQEIYKVLVIDEINRAPLASVLGELIYGLEYRGENIDTPYELKDENGNPIPLKIPKNLYIIGTMNTADRSIGSMDYAVRRRFAFVPVLSEASAIQNTWNHIGEAVEGFYHALISQCFTDELKGDPDLDIDDIKIGHTYFLGNKELYPNETDEKNYFEYRIKYQIWPIYQEYIKDGLMKKAGEETFKNYVRMHWPNIEL